MCSCVILGKKVNLIFVLIIWLRINHFGLQLVRIRQIVLVLVFVLN